VCSVLAGALVLSQWKREPLKVSGFIEAHEVRVGSRVGGRVHRVAVSEGQRVSVGDLLIELEPFDLLERRAEAAARLAQQKDEHERLQAGFRSEEIAQAKARRDQLAAHLEELKVGPRIQEIAAAKAEVALAEAELDLATQRHGRTENLFGRKVATREDMDEATANLRTARAAVQVRKEALALLEAGTRPEQITQATAQLEEADEAWKLTQHGYRKEDIAAAEAAVQAAEAALEAVDRQIEELKVVSPVAGVVEAVELRPGDLVAANAPMISVMDTGELWVRAYVPENHLDLQIDQEVMITVDSFPDRRFAGRITFIARQAEFTPGNVQTPEERSKQVFRVKVDVTEGRDVLRPGMAADVWLDAGSRPQ
jgi:multidrug resistance efflux pump